MNQWLQHTINFILDTPRSRFGGKRCVARPLTRQRQGGGESRTTPTRKAKPAGVLGAEIWVNVVPIGQPTSGDPPLTNDRGNRLLGVASRTSFVQGPDTFRFVALDTQTPYTLDFDAADGGKNAHYLLRWVNSTGQKGPWSETATIGA